MKKIWWNVLLVIWVLVFLLNVTAWISPEFCDWYIYHVFPIWLNTYGRIIGLLPFSVGEIMLVLGVVLVVFAAVSLLFLVTGGLVSKISKGKGWKQYCFVSSCYLKIFFCIFTSVSLVMTLNCFLLYHASTLSERYFGNIAKEYSIEELIELRNYVVTQCNTLSGKVERDALGNLVYRGNIEDTAINAMQTLGETYENLQGFYPKPKPLFYSDFFSQQYMAGYYFPFSMEANYNNTMYIANKPSTICHELAHLKGYIYEDEANFLGYLACIQSEDVFFQYSGYLSVLYYLDNDFYDAVGGNMKSYLAQDRILPKVHTDNIFLTLEEWDRVEKKALLDTEVVDAVSDSFTDTTLKWNGVSDGLISYNRVVELLLQYYDVYGD